MFREMVSSEAIVRMNPKTLEMARLDDRERPVIQQIFGSDPAVMAEAARIIEEKFHPDGIDINMGCPVYNLVSNFNGAFLIKEPKRASAIVKAMTAAVRVPISVKTRLGWKEDTDVLEFVNVIEQAGASLISIHGRTKEQGYSGKANWDRIGEARRKTSLPVLVNGDITSRATAEEALRRSGADGVLIGRGALGNPWIFRTLLPTTYCLPPSLVDRIAVVQEHARHHVAQHGERGMVSFRKHLAYYFKKELRHEAPHLDWNAIRSKLVRVETQTELDEILKQVESHSSSPGNDGR